MGREKLTKGGNFDYGRYGVLTIIVVLLFWLMSLSFFAPLDNLIRDLRFEYDNRTPTGEVVLVEIDPKSLEHFGVWPWPRSLHAQVIDALVEYGAYNIALDIDFSSHSSPENDAAMASALDAAGGFVILASFAQQSGSDGKVTFNRPIPEFAANSWVASVNVGVDIDGRVRSFPYSSMIDGQRISSFPAAISGVESGEGVGFLIDYSIDAFKIDRISFLDVLEGNVAPERLANKNVIIGAGAVELRDNFAVSRYGVISGPMLQVLATETLLQSRQLQGVSYWYSFAALVIMGLAFISVFQKLTLWQIVLGALFSIISTEALGFYLQSKYGLIYNTGAIHVGYLLFLLASLAFELERRLGLFRRASQQKAATQAILNQVVTDNFDGVVVVDQARKIRMASGLAEAVLNPNSAKTLVGAWAQDVLPNEFWHAIENALDEKNDSQPQSKVPRQVSLTGESGEDIFLEYVVTRSIIQESQKDNVRQVHSSTVKAIACLTFRDITERLKAAQKIKYVAHHDSLTGALWRVKLAEEITDILDTEMGLLRGITVGALDLRRFKEVNETLGHRVGDQLLVQAVERLRGCNIAHVGRLGGHSFVFCTSAALDKDELEKFCNVLVKRLCEPYHLGEHRVIVGASIGVTDSFISGSLPDILLAHADMALSSAGSSSRKSYHVYSNELEDKLLKKQEVERALRNALANEELWVAYQPQVCLKSGDLIGVEALIRWEHPEWGVVGPDQFIPVAEETGLIVEIGQWILEKACLDAAGWPVPINLAVNVSPLQFEFCEVCAGVDLALQRSGLPAERLDIEITESSFVDQSQGIIDTLERLQNLGVGVALDDFGTGYSSLSYLSRLPIDKIKVDQSFVRGLPQDKAMGAIVQSVLALGGALNKKIVAEGIETEEQAQILRQGGAQIGQGWLFGKPMNDKELRGQMLKQFWRDCDEDASTQKAG